MWRAASLLALLVAEILYLTISFDTAALGKLSAPWAPLVGWTPQYLRLAITVVAVTLLTSGARVWAAIRDPHPRAAWQAPAWLAANLAAFAVFSRVTAVVMGAGFSAVPNQGLWAAGWFAAGSLTLIAWGLTWLSVRTWLTAARAGRWGLLLGFGVGCAAWAAGFLTQDLWRPLARYTFTVVQWILRGLYSDTVSDPNTLVVGTRVFKVTIAPSCSGYEGVGLILAFLGVYLWLSRKTLRFPHALVLLPLGAAAVWVLNAVRIATLVVIGTSGWRNVALGGFHSQAGWLAFNAVGLGLVAITIRGGYFVTTAERRVGAGESSDQTTAYLAPFLAILATSMITGALSAGFDPLYPVRVVAAAAALWTFRKSYTDFRWSWSWGAVGIGAVTFAIWVALAPAVSPDKDGWPAALGTLHPGWAAFWLVNRAIGYVVMIPIAEELAFRGFLPRRLMRADFQAVPPGEFTWTTWIVSSVLFGALHGTMWPAGTIAGLLFGFALHRRRALGDAVQAHATTNLLLALYAFGTGRWSVWS
jgi:exosortase E/protease (VPEID-CTERM system)